MQNTNETINWNSYASKYSSIDASLGSFVSNVVTKASGDSLDSVRQCIVDIHDLIESRKTLHQKIMSDLDNAEMQVSTFLNTMSSGADAGSREQMMLFKSKEIEIAEAKRKEQLLCWQDIAKLREELRQYTRELNEKESRMSMLDNILND